MSTRTKLLVAVTVAALQPAAAVRATAGTKATLPGRQRVCPSAPVKASLSDQTGRAADDKRGQAAEAYGKLPLAFEAATYGQGADFLARGSAYSLGLTAAEAVFALAPRTEHARPDEREVHAARTLRMRLVGANPAAHGSAEERLPGVVNYFGGNDPARWRTHVPTFSRVRYTSVYPGIDLTYYGNQRQLEYDFVVSAGADPLAIGLDFGGAESVEIDAEGGLVLGLGGRALRWQAPVMYQAIGAERLPVAGAYRLLARGGPSTTSAGAPRVGFSVGPYDRGAPLVIDPVLTYSSFLGASGFDHASSVAVDEPGHAFVVGHTTSAGFPVANAWQAANAGSHEAFVTKLDETGSTLVYSTYLGGSLWDEAHGIAIDAAHAAYVTGKTTSDDFPTTVGAYDRTYNGGDDVFVAKLDKDGVLVYATYVGSEDNEHGTDIAVQNNGRAYVTGITDSPGFPTTAGAYDTTHNGLIDAFALRLTANGSALSYSTFLGGNSFDYGYGIALSGNEAYVVGSTSSANFPTRLGYDMTHNGGSDVFATRVAGDGASVVASTFVGGSGSDFATEVALGDAGAVYITGGTSSVNYPATAGAYDTTLNGSGDVHVTKLDAALASVIYATYAGGLGYDTGEGIAVNTFGGALVTGSTESADFPTVDPIQATFGGGTRDAFVLRVNPTGTALNFSTYLGGPGYDLGQGIALDGCGNPVIVGETADGFPTTAGAFDETSNGGADAFVTKMQP